MANPITHTFVSGISDGTDSTLVRPSNWNASHVVPEIWMQNRKPTQDVVVPDGYCAVVLYYLALASKALILQGDSVMAVGMNNYPGF